MKSGEIWKARKNTIRCEWDMLRIIRSLGNDMWLVDYFPAEDIPPEELAHIEDCYEEGEISREELLDQFYRVSY